MLTYDRLEITVSYRLMAPKSERITTMRSPRVCPVLRLRGMHSA